LTCVVFFQPTITGFLNQQIHLVIVNQANRTYTYNYIYKKKG
jgi:hypothetical protein